jgi:hypothetical protein
LWFGGITVSPFIIRRLVQYGQGFHPFGQPGREELDALRGAMTAAGRSSDALEIVGGLRPVFDTPDRPADVDSALEGVAWQIEQGYNTFCFNPSQYVDDVTKVPELCRRLVSWAEQL